MKASKFFKLKARNESKKTEVVVVEQQVESLTETVKEEVVEELPLTVEPSASEVKPVLKKKVIKNA